MAPTSLASSPTDCGMTETLAYDGTEADIATLRRVAVAVVVLSSAALAGLAQAWWAYLIAGLSLIAVHFWVRRLSLHASRKSSLDGRGIVLDEKALRVPHEDGSEAHIERASIESVSIDHERLLVCVVHGVECEEIEPSFGRLGLEGLARKVDQWRREPPPTRSA